MGKISRNSPCPCGSGKKYKHCCLDNVIEFPVKNNFMGEEQKNVSDILGMVKDDFEQREYSSLEEINEEFQQFDAIQNSRPKLPFLGLSPNHVHNIIYSPFSLNNEIFNFECENTEEMRGIPFIEQAFYIMRKLMDAGQLKGTQKGNLSKAFVVELYHQFFSDERYARLPHREDDLPQVTRLKHVLDMAGLIKKRANKYSLTKKGEKILDGDNISELFHVLVDTFFNKWNWGYSDGYSELALIQTSAVFNFFLLKKMAQDWVLDKELGETYLNAFPALVREVTNSPFGPEEEIVSCFCLRFLSRVCVPMGLLEAKEEGDFFERKVFYKVTPFFNKVFKFHC